MNILKFNENFGMNECCDPVTAITIASAAFSAVGAIRQGNAAKAEADYQAQIAEQNRGIVAQQTQAQLEVQDRERRIRRGRSIASSGASGVGIESFGDILASNAEQERLDVLTIQSEGLLRQNNYTQEANLARARGSNAQTSGYIGAASSVLGAASSLYKPPTPETINWSGGGSTTVKSTGVRF
jgi:hypothetical protein